METWRMSKFPNPLKRALAVVVDAARDGNRGHVSTALRYLANTIDSVVDQSDRGLSRTRPDEPFGRAQRRNVAEIRHLSRTAMSGRRESLPGLARTARAEMVRACRSQVRKVRLSRAHASDLPGGEG